MKRAVLLGLGALAVACARPYAPPGGERDVVPPGLESTSPEPLSVVSPSDDAVVFRFNERISQRQFNRTLVTVSPARPEDVNPDVSGRELRISLEGGWQPGRVYQILVRPGIEDLFGNERRDPVELIFSTGDPPPPSAIAGVLTERITAAPPREGVLEATRRGDSATYVAAADSAGFFALRHVPYGTYDVTAYSDVNRNRRRDGSEPFAAPVTAEIGAGQDTAVVALVLLPNDTTPPRLTGADRIDSTHIRLSFDDYIDPDADLSTVTVQVLAPDSSALTYVARVLSEAAYERERAVADSLQREATADSVRRAEAAADTTERAAAPRPALPRPAPAAAVPSEPAAARTLIVLLDRPLPPAEVLVRVAGVPNVNGLVGGGVEDVEYEPPRATPDPTEPAPTDPSEPAREPPPARR